MKQFKKLDQNGVVSIISVVIFATLVTVLVTAIVSSSVVQQNQANSYDLGTRAYYAAESGIQDAVRGLNADPTLLANGQTTCAPLTDGINATTDDLGAGSLGKANSGISSSGVNYTCQLLSTKLDALTGRVGDASAVTLQLDPQAADATTYKLVLNWSLNKATDSSAVELQGRTDTSQLFVPRDQWANSNNVKIHPVMKAALISLPKGTYTRADIDQNVLFLNPIDSVPTAATIANFSLAGHQDPATVVSNVQCFSNKDTNNNFNGYSCQRTITLTNYNFSTTNVYLRLHTIYGGTDATEFRVSLIRSSDNSVAKLANSQATIDVTGKAGSVFKRVKETVSIGNGNNTDSLPDAAVVAGDGICKLFRVGSSASQFQPDCNPLN